MIRSWRRLIAMMLHVMGTADFAVADLVGIRHAIGRGRPVAKGENCWRRHEAKRGEHRKQNREPKRQAGSERSQHDPEALFFF
jgi:hypothetical protein